MTTWIGGGNNKASNPRLWSPNGAPVSGESLSVTATPGNPGPFKMNVEGNDLAGDTVSIGALLTANLSHQAIMSAEVLAGETATFNLSQRSTLIETVDGTASAVIDMKGPADIVTDSGPSTGNKTINMSVGDSAGVGTQGHMTVNMIGGDTANVTAGLGGTATVNMSGSDNATISAVRFATANVNLGVGAVWSGTVLADYFSHVNVQGGADSAFNNNGDSALYYPGGTATIGVDVIGRGIFTVSTYGDGIDFAKSVGPQQSIMLAGGDLGIEEPNQFKASVTLLGGPAQIGLAGLITADSYSFKNDILDIWVGHRIIDVLRLSEPNPLYGVSAQNPYGFVVEPPTGTGSLVITTLSPGVSPPAGLPVHN